MTTKPLTQTESLGQLIPEGVLNPVEVSIVVPCLNEAKTIRPVVRTIRDTFEKTPYSFEIIVADNGSTDESVSLAESEGARIIHVATRGYGAALKAGIMGAKFPYVLFGDADMTYDFREGPALIHHLLESKASMVLGTRTRGIIEKGAMRPIHRYLGTPVLTRLINVLFRARITDCNSGFRALRTADFASWQVSSDGMEFASELIINCLKSGGIIVETPISLRKDDENRVPHLSTWRDGMRHLLFIISRAPHGFAYTGFSLTFLSLLTAFPCMLIGQTRIAGMSIFDLHTLILSIFVGFIGVQSLTYGLILESRAITLLPMNRIFLDIREVTILKVLISTLLIFGLFVAFIFGVWIKHGFNNLHYYRLSLSILYLTIVIGGLGYGILIAHVNKRL